MRVEQKRGPKGSLRWIQDFVNYRPAELDAAIRSACDGIGTPIEWTSPLEGDQFSEYRDKKFLDRLGVSLPNRPLDDFWPARGPQWDALGIDTSGAPVLVEAKSHINEMLSSPTKANGNSRKMILEALRETEEHLGAKSTCDWSGRFFQYANRLAHLYLLHELNDVSAWLVFVYFVGDVEMGGPRTEREWRAAIKVLEGALGLRRHKMLKRRVEVFVHL